jgi:hypothetical protein
MVSSETGKIIARITFRRYAAAIGRCFPEANPFIAPGRRDPVALVPDYNAVVEVGIV